MKRRRKTEAERKNGAAERRREELAEKRGIAAGVGGPRQDVRIKFQVQMGRWLGLAQARRLALVQVQNNKTVYIYIYI